MILLMQIFRHIRTDMVMMILRNCMNGSKSDYHSLIKLGSMV